MNKETKMRNLANAHNASLLFHQVFSLENCQSIERKLGDMQRVKGKKGSYQKADYIGFPQEESLPASADTLAESAPREMADLTPGYG